MALPLLGAAASGLGGLIGGLFGSDNEAAAEEARRQALQEISGVRIPTIEEQQIALERLQLQGTLDPIMEGVETLGPSEMGAISLDPELRAAQMAALRDMGSIARGGLSATDRANINEIRARNAQQVRAQEESIMQEMARRGMGGSNQELVARMQAAQMGANRASSEGDRIAAMAEQARREALSQQASMAGNVRGADFGEASAKAQAADAIARFNAANKQGVMTRNVGASREAEAANLAAKQRLADANVGLSNQQQMYNKALIQQQYRNQMERAQAKANALAGEAAAQKQEAAQDRAMGSGIGNTVGQGIIAYGAREDQKEKDALDRAERAEARRYYSTGGGTGSNNKPFAW
jgi:hypothetical protein